MCAHRILTTHVGSLVRPDALLPHVRQILTCAKSQLAELLKTRRSLRTLILIEDKASFRFAKHLGFRVVENAESSFETVWMEI